MKEESNIISNLKSFIARDKFSHSAWENRGLISPDDNFSKSIDNKLNHTARKLIDLIASNSSNKTLKSGLKNELLSYQSMDYDTEEREMICDYFIELSNIISVDILKDINNWMYGKNLFGSLIDNIISKHKQKIIETLSQKCTGCEANLETFILEKEKGIPEPDWTIIQCVFCGEYNLLSAVPNIKKLKFGQYLPVEQLSRANFNKEEAEVRLEQIKQFRK